MTNQLEVTVADGKYTVIQRPDGRLVALRYGKEWRDCCGDGLIYALAAEIEELRNWKESAIKVMPDFQKIGELLEIPLGKGVSENIVPEIIKLKEEIKSLKTTTN